VTEIALTGEIASGRTIDNVLRLPETSVSGSHAKLTLTDAGCFLTDLESRNGTVLDGERVAPQEPVELCGGERIGVGSYELMYVPPNMTAELPVEAVGGEWTDDVILPKPRLRRRRSPLQRALAVIALLMSVAALAVVVLSRVL
jgi:pSer/pThr/pTyr-binding forkhead associated (FHA) protein